MSERDELADDLEAGLDIEGAAEHLIEAGYHKGHEEWGLMYEQPDRAPAYATRVVPMPDRAHAEAALQTGAPLRGRNRRIVHRYVTDWTETQ